MGGRDTMTALTKLELQYTLSMLNGFSEPDDKIASTIRKKLVAQIKSMPDAEPEFYSMQ